MTVMREMLFGGQGYPSPAGHASCSAPAPPYRLLDLAAPQQTDTRGGMRRPPPLGPPGAGAGSTPGPGLAGTPVTPYGHGSHGGTPLVGMSPMAGGQPGTPFGGAGGSMPLPPQPPHSAGLAAHRSMSGPMGPGGAAGLHMRAGSVPLTPLQAQQQQHAAMMMGGYGGGRMVSPHGHGHPGAMHGYPGGQMQAGGAYVGASPAHPTQHHTHQHQHQHQQQGHSGGGGLGSAAALQGSESGSAPPLPPLPSEPPPPPPPPLPGGHEPATSAPVTWHGGLAKSGVPHCTLVCRQGGATGPGAAQGQGGLGQGMVRCRNKYAPKFCKDCGGVRTGRGQRPLYGNVTHCFSISQLHAAACRLHRSAKAARPGCKPRLSEPRSGHCGLQRHAVLGS